jgi:penicillin-binding protein 1A
LAFDSKVDSGLYDAGRDFNEIWLRICAYSDRMKARGPWRIANELACEGLTLGLAGGILMVALAIPAFRETSDDWLKQPELAVTFLDRYGNEIGKRGIRHDDTLSIHDIPDILIKAVLATEDRRFYDHFGIDIVGTFRAAFANARAEGVVQGGSSLTQQLAKNLFLSNERSLERKIKEAFLALWLESRLTKNEILKLYLDRAYMGGSTFGVAAAADFYFGKPLKDITLPEAAMLAGLFKAPTRYAPHVNLPAARARANDVLTNMVAANVLSEGQAEMARRNPATPIDRHHEMSPDYYLDWAFEEVKHLSDEGKLGDDRVLTVKTGLDVFAQHSAESSLEDNLRRDGKRFHAGQGAMVIMEPDGAVRAMVGGRDYGASQFNRATNALRQPGSSFKPFVYTTALSAGLYKPNSIVVDAPICIGNWCPHNYGRSYAGAIPLVTALAKSINTIPVRMSIALGKGNSKVGRAKIIEMSHRMGLTTDLEDTPSLPIGAGVVTVVDMAAGYSVFANGGKRAKPYAAIEVRNGRGEVVWRHDNEPPPAQVVAPSVIADMNFMLNRVVEGGTGGRARIPGATVAGKTGTTNAYRDAWFVGFTGNLVASVWLGNDDYSSTRNLTGGVLPAQIWHDAMAPLVQGVEQKPLLGLDQKPNAPAKPPEAQNTPVAEVGRAPMMLSRRSYEVLTGVSDLFKAAGPASRRTAGTLPPNAPPGTSVVGSAAETIALP